jgi:hypothetical protein
MMCVVVAMTTASPIRSTPSAYDSGAFHTGNRRFQSYPAFA